MARNRTQRQFQRPQGAHGGVTKAGNGHLRRALTSGNASISIRKPGKKKLAVGQQAVSPAVARIAAKANDRLLDRYRHLTGDLKKNACKARTAVVSEQIRWVWVIGRAVQAEVAAAR